MASLSLIEGLVAESVYRSHRTHLAALGSDRRFGVSFVGRGSFSPHDYDVTFPACRRPERMVRKLCLEFLSGVGIDQVIPTWISLIAVEADRYQDGNRYQEEKQ